MMETTAVWKSPLLGGAEAVGAARRPYLRN